MRLNHCLNDSILDEVIYAKDIISKTQKATHKEYGGNILKYIQQLEKNPNFNYIINSTPRQLANTYTDILKDIAKTVYNPNFSQKQNVINVLEYNRVMSMYENVKMKSEDDKHISSLTQYPIFLALLGKGVCAAQARFVRDILEQMNIDAGTYSLNTDTFTLKVSELNHHVTIANIDNSSIYYLDPTNYNGTLDGFQFEVQQFNLDKLKKRGINVRGDFCATQEEIKKSRDFVFPRLIKKLGIDEISKQLKLEKKESLQKQCTILAFIESRLNLTGNLETDISSANLNGINIEVGKLMELFLYQNNIEYSIDCEVEKQNSVYITKMGEREVYLYPKHAFSSSYNATLKYPHYIIDHEKRITLPSLNDKMQITYTHLINQGRADVLYQTVKNICKTNDIDRSTFIKSPMEYMKKYAPEVPVFPAIMEKLVEHIKSTIPEYNNSNLSAHEIINSVSRVATTSGMDNAMNEMLQTSKSSSIEHNHGISYGGK